MKKKELIKNEKVGKNECEEKKKRMEILKSFRKKKPKHPLYIGSKIKANTIQRDDKTGVLLKAQIHPFQSLGAGKTRGLGLQVMELQPANKIIAISNEELRTMDLGTFNEKDYIDNAWYIFGKRACPANDFTMLANAKAPMNEHGDVEDVNAELICNTIPPKCLTTLLPGIYPGKYVYLRTKKVLKPNEFVILDKYGNGRESLPWGQTPTLKRQIDAMSRFTENEDVRLNNPQGGNKTCDCCGIPLPRSKKQTRVHRTLCTKILLNSKK